MTTFEFARIYDDIGGDFRVLADRLWPRGAFVRECAGHPVVTLLTAAKDPAHSHVTVLAAVVQAQMDTI